MVLLGVRSFSLFQKQRVLEMGASAIHCFGVGRRHRRGKKSYKELTWSRDRHERLLVDRQKLGKNQHVHAIYMSSFTRLCSIWRAKEHCAWKSHSRELPVLPKAQLLMAHLMNQTLTEREPHPGITPNAEHIMKSRDKTQDIRKIMICPRHGHQVAQNPASSKLSKKLKVRKQDFPLNFLAATAVAPCEAIKPCG